MKFTNIFILILMAFMVNVQAGSLPTGLSGLDIGEMGPDPSTIDYTAGSYDITAAGDGVASTADGFHYIYLAETGDVDVIVRVFESTKSKVNRAGIMLRETLDDDAANVMLSVSGRKNIKLTSRATTASTTITVATAASNKRKKNWLWLKRQGATVLAYHSLNGASWSLIGNTLFSPNSFYVGIATTSNDTAVVDTFTLDNFSVNSIAYRVTAPSPNFELTYTNPFQDFLDLDIQGADSQMEIQLFNTHGQLVYRMTAYDHFNGRIETAMLPRGHYFLHVKTSNRQKVHRLVKQ